MIIIFECSLVKLALLLPDEGDLIVSLLQQVLQLRIFVSKAFRHIFVLLRPLFRCQAETAPGLDAEVALAVFRLRRYCVLQLQQALELPVLKL